MAETVARILSIRAAGKHEYRFMFKQDHFVPLQEVQSALATTRTIAVPAVVMRKDAAGRTLYSVAQENMLLNIHDFIWTAPDAVLAIEFLIGGRVGVNSSTLIEIVNERAVADGNNGSKRMFLKNFSLWMKSDAKRLKEPIEIQTNGGVMGIKG